MTTPVPLPETAKPRTCSKCKAALAPDANPCPACGAWQRKMSVRRVLHGLTVGKREEDKTARKTTAAGGTAGLILYMFTSSQSQAQAEAKAWRELTQRQHEEALATAKDSTAVLGRLEKATVAQTETFQSLNFTLNRLEGKAADKGAKIPAARVEVSPVPGRKR